ARHVRLFLADRDIDAIERAVVFVTGGFRRFVESGLADNGVHTDGGLAGRAVTNDQFALAAANRDHGIHRHDAGLHRLADGLALDDAGGDFFHRISEVGFDRAF